MAIRGFKPTTPSRRKMTVATFEEITKTTPEKSLVTTINKTAGRKIRLNTTYFTIQNNAFRLIRSDIRPNFSHTISTIRI